MSRPRPPAPRAESVAQLLVLVLRLPTSACSWRGRDSALIPYQIEPPCHFLAAVLRRQRLRVIPVVVQRLEDALHTKLFRNPDPVVVVLDQYCRRIVFADRSV